MKNHDIDVDGQKRIKIIGLNFKSKLSHNIKFEFLTFCGLNLTYYYVLIDFCLLPIIV